jgi:hypothetical protein
MSDILKDLLQAYYNEIDALKGSHLSYLAHHEIVQPPLSLSGWPGNLPLVLIQPGSVTLTPDCMAGTYRSDTKHYTIILSGFVEYYDENYGTMGKDALNYKGALDLAIDLEANFNRKTFGLSLACVLTSINFSKLSLPQFEETGGSWVHSCELTFDHLWEDKRFYDYA